jgi:hypothetical protein
VLEGVCKCVCINKMFIQGPQTPPCGGVLTSVVLIPHAVEASGCVAAGGVGVNSCPRKAIAIVREVLWLVVVFLKGGIKLSDRPLREAFQLLCLVPAGLYRGPMGGAYWGAAVGYVLCSPTGG